LNNGRYVGCVYKSYKQYHGSFLVTSSGPLAEQWERYGLSPRFENETSTAPGAPAVTPGEIFGVLAIAAFIANYGSWIGAFSNSAGLGDVSFGCFLM
jgi:hypothetical protein